MKLLPSTDSQFRVFLGQRHFFICFCSGKAVPRPSRTRVRWQRGAFPTTKADGITKHFSKREIHKCLGQRGIHKRVVRELHSGVVRLFSIILERLRKVCEFSDWKRQMLHPPKRATICGGARWTQYLENYRKISSWKLFWGTWRTSWQLGTVCIDLPSSCLISLIALIPLFLLSTPSPAHLGKGWTVGVLEQTAARFHIWCHSTYQLAILADVSLQLFNQQCAGMKNLPLLP